MTERITASALIRSAALGKAEQADVPAPSTGESRTYQTITKLLGSGDHSALYGYTSQVLRMIVAHPERESLRQQALDILRAEDDYAKGTR